MTHAKIINLDPDGTGGTTYAPLTHACILLLRGGYVQEAHAILVWISSDIADHVAQAVAAELDRAAPPPAAPPPTRYATPAVPLVGTQLRDHYGYGWTVELDADLESYGQVMRILVRAPRLDQDPDPLNDPSIFNKGRIWAWNGTTIDERGGFDVVPQDPEDARLYGPIGERWGNPDKPCPFQPAGCTLGLGHTGPHVDAQGAELPPLARDVEPLIRQTSPVVCTCGRPENHAPGCPRHVLAHGAIDPTIALPVPQDQALTPEELRDMEDTGTAGNF